MTIRKPIKRQMGIERALPTIRTRAPKRIHGAALASSDARKVDELAALIIGYRAATLPAVTAAMEGL